MINQTQEKPLSGITVIDLTRVLAGPFCTMMLADQGARVIKVELSGSGDDARMYGPNVNEMSGYFASINRGKESIALNLKDEEDRKVFEALLAKADVLTENFRPGVMERLGYDWRLYTVNSLALFTVRYQGLVSMAALTVISQRMIWWFRAWVAL